MTTRGITVAAMAFVVTIVAIAVLSRLAPALGLVDRPGGRKDHSESVPVVGGIALALALVAGESLLGRAAIPASFLAAAIILVAVSIWDDLRDIHHVPRLGAQVIAVLVMVYGAGVQLDSLGDLLGWRPVDLSVLAVPVTLFAVVGVINAANMIDGIDGLCGSIALVAFAWYGAAADHLGNAGLAGLAWLLCGGLAGFLIFNLRLPWRPQARVFLGDAGSTLLGFAMAWFAIALSQGAGPVMPPIAALWVVLLPLADTVSLMARRIMRGRSPFHPDREHIHHFLLAHGLSVNAALALLVAVSTAFGAVGVLGWRAGVPEPVLFWAFFFLFFAYHFAIRAGWRRLDACSVPSPLPASRRTLPGHHDQ